MIIPHHTRTNSRKTTDPIEVVLVEELSCFIVSWRVGKAKGAVSYPP
jgi:hypothetical protein